MKAAYLGWLPLSWTRSVYRSGPRRCVRGAKAGLGLAVLSLGYQATNLPEIRTTATSGHRRGRVSKLRGVSEPNVWLHSSSWITTQELGLKAVFNETTHCVLLHILSSFTLY